jgi:hypothetical protein
MRKLCLILFFITINFSFLFGSTYIVIEGSIGNVYYDGIMEGESKYQNQAIAFLCYQYIQQYFPKIKENIYLELGFSDDRNTNLSYDKYQGQRWKNAEENRPVKGKGIRIQFSQRQDRAKNVLKLLEYGLSNLKQLKTNGTAVFSNISTILKAPTSQNIDSILQIKVYRNLETYTSYNEKRQWYFQNDRYFFIDFFNKDSVYLVLKEINQIISEYYIGTIIFETDSTGYFFNRQTKKLSEKFTISNKLESFYYIHTSSDFQKRWIYFEYEPYQSDVAKKKFIYLANELFLVDKIEEYEDIWVKHALEMKEK